MDRGSSVETDSSVHLNMFELKRLSDDHSKAAGTSFEAPINTNKTDSSTTSNPSNTISLNPTTRAPEKKLTLFALRLSILEKTATGLGTLGFIWATVVLLGGFAITLDKTDFWFITIILLIEGTRIFSRSHELEWQLQSTWSLTDAGMNSFRRSLRSSSGFLRRTLNAIFRPSMSAVQSPQGREIARGVTNRDTTEKWDGQKMQSRQWASADVPLLPYDQWVFLSKNISKLLHWLQIISALACVFLSLMKLILHNYGEVSKGDSDKRNRKSALTIFYSLALAEALLFLLEKAYWELNIFHCKILEKVASECELEASGLVSVRRFFYDAYSRCVNGSIFDGLKMDMVSFGMDLLASNSSDEQLIGARILRRFATREKFANDTLQRIGVTSSVTERLVEMLNWKDPQEEEIRESAAEILSKLAGKKQNSLRVAGIPGAMESISSLLYTKRHTSCSSVDEIGEKSTFNHKHCFYDFWTFNHLGLLILKKLARDHDICGKIGNTRGLLPKIVEFTHAEERLLKDNNATPSQILTVKRSLQVVNMLASTTGTTGKQLRIEISEIVFTVSNIRDILRYGEHHPILQKLGIEIMTNLALEDDATERIGGTGGLLKELLTIFFRDQGIVECHNHVRTAAGEALAMLALKSKNNCRRILRTGALEKLVKTLEVPLLRDHAARILRNLCSYSGEECYMELRKVTAAVPMVLKGIMSPENKQQELMVGLAARAFQFMVSEESSIMFERSGISESELANALVQILRNYTNPTATMPRIRRFTIELSLWMMRDSTRNIEMFKRLGFVKELQNVLDTTSEIESFNIFSGTLGLSRYKISIHSLVEDALNLLDSK